MSNSENLRNFLRDFKLQKSCFIIIVGVSGAGKTTLLKSLEKQFSFPNISYNYFDDVGVPSEKEMIEKYGSGEKWQEVIAHKWLEKLSKIQGMKLIFLEGSFNPQFAIEKFQSLKITNYLLFCLDAEKEDREQRLIQKRNQPELVTEEMENWAQFLKNKTLYLGGKIIPSYRDDIEKSAHILMEALLQSLALPSK